jgi:hypothetical protein
MLGKYPILTSPACPCCGLLLLLLLPAPALLLEPSVNEDATTAAAIAAAMANLIEFFMAVLSWRPFNTAFNHAENRDYAQGL